MLEGPKKSFVVVFFCSNGLTFLGNVLNNVAEDKLYPIEQKIFLMQKKFVG